MWVDAAIAATRRAIWLPVAVLATHVVASRLLHAYAIFPQFDTPMHMIGGFSVAYPAAVFIKTLSSRGLIRRPRALVSAVLVIATVAAAAVLWECAEYLSDRFVGTYSQQGPVDTVLDVVFGIVGGLMFVIAAGLGARRGSAP